MPPEILQKWDPVAVRRILESLPDWFEDPGAIDNYEMAAADIEFVSIVAVDSGGDPVARLAGSANPDRSNWTTVNENAPTLSRDASAPGILGAHYSDRYAEFAKSAFASGNVSVDSWQASADGFFSGSDTHVDYGAQR